MYNVLGTLSLNFIEISLLENPKNGLFLLLFFEVLKDQ